MKVQIPAEPHFVLSEVRRRHRDLAAYIDGIAEQPLSFRGLDAISHSAANHQHLWMIEWWADKDQAVDLAFRCAATAYILHRWRQRLAGYAPHAVRGYRMYLYEDLAPTVSVVAETGGGCPYGGDLTFVARIEDVLKPYATRSWMANFRGGWPTPEAVLKAARGEDGSLRATAQVLKLPLAETRRVIERYGIAKEVNAIRKHAGRRPARFADADLMLPKLRIWEWKIGRDC